MSAETRKSDSPEPSADYKLWLQKRDEILAGTELLSVLFNYEGNAAERIEKIELLLGESEHMRKVREVLSKICPFLLHWLAVEYSRTELEMIDFLRMEVFGRPHKPGTVNHVSTPSDFLDPVELDEDGSYLKKLLFSNDTAMAYANGGEDGMEEYFILNGDPDYDEDELEEDPGLGLDEILDRAANLNLLGLKELEMLYNDIPASDLVAALEEMYGSRQPDWEFSANIAGWLLRCIANNHSIQPMEMALYLQSFALKMKYVEPQAEDFS